MPKTITLSETVLAAIQKHRRDGEDTKDAVLRRLLGCGEGGNTTEAGWECTAAAADVGNCARPVRGSGNSHCI